MVDTKERFTNVGELIDQKKYFILHAPRQTGKTTNMIQLARQLNEEGQYIVLYLNVEAGQPLRNQVDRVNNLVISAFERMAKIYLPSEYRPSEDCFKIRAMEEGIGEFLSNWCLELPKPLVVFMDEVDALIGDSLISVLRQLRGGYANRPRAFPHALCLIGLRDMRDYRIFSDETQRYVIEGSAFNIKDKSIRIENFTKAQVHNLFQQHTDATGQLFSEEALDLIFESTQGQPWLVNAIGRELCFEEHAIPCDQMISPDDVKNAIEILILRRDVHLDQLADKLTEPRVAKIIQTILIGEADGVSQQTTNEHQQYLIDLGLIRVGKNGLEIANPIYREIIPRELTWYQQNILGQDPAWYVKENGQLDIQKLLDAYIEFYKEHSELITARQTYTEAAHHLLFMAWLQRIVNGGGRISREYAAGLGRLDLCIEYAGERFAFELKRSGKRALEKGKIQLTGYLNRLNLNSGWLVIFNRYPVEDWEIVGKREYVDYQGKHIEVIWL